MLDKTPFYSQSGGQIGDRGEIEGRGYVLESKKFLDMHFSKIEVRRVLSMGDVVVATVDRSREQITKHHSATHLLHAGLSDILGNHISQAGSLVQSDRLRFDFSHPKALSTEEIAEIEKWVNSQIAQAVPTQTKEMPIEEAQSSGAKAQFGEKYGAKVRVVSMGEASVEFCGGTHVENASEIGLFIISKESGVSAGVRRIEAICSTSAIRYIANLRTEIDTIKSTLKNNDTLAGISKLKTEIKSLKSELKEAMNSSKKDLETQEINGTTVIVEEVENGDIKTLIDEAKNQYPNIAIMLFQKKGDKVLIACGSKETAIKAGNWIKEIAPILGGGGGGRPDFAQAGGKDASKIGEAKIKALVYLEANL
jgi:alanyl-tRNA synthetase